MTGATGRCRVRSIVARRAAAVVLCALASAACDPGELQFRNDHRLGFEAPGARELVQVPVTVRWSMEDFEAVGLDGSNENDRGAFVVFVDRAPMPVGKDLAWLARDDDGCRRDPRCPDERYLVERGVHVTTRTSLTLAVLPRVSDGAGDEHHYVNIVLVDGTGRRIGESAWYRPFRTPRRSS